MLVRDFEERDAGQVARIMFESFKTFLGERMKESRPEPEAYWIRCSSEKTERSITRSFVAETDGRVIGYLCVSADTRSGLGILHRIGVDPEVFARGCGRALFHAAELFWKELKMRKIYTCTSHIGVDEIQLAKFYE